MIPPGPRCSASLVVLLVGAGQSCRGQEGLTVHRRNESDEAVKVFCRWVIGCRTGAGRERGLVFHVDVKAGLRESSGSQWVEVGYHSCLRTSSGIFQKCSSGQVWLHIGSNPGGDVRPSLCLCGRPPPTHTDMPPARAPGPQRAGAPGQASGWWVCHYESDTTSAGDQGNWPRQS